MKAFKFFFFAVAMTFAMNASAQFASAGGSKSSGSSSASDKSNFFLFDVRLGGVSGAGGFGLNFGGEKRYNDYIAWDYINIEFAAPFDSPANYDMISAKTGVRGFSPSFANDKLRAYTNLAVGYTCVLAEDWWSGDMEANHGFGLTFGIGIQFNKKYSIGYSLQYETAFKSKSHLATFGFAF